MLPAATPRLVASVPPVASATVEVVTLVVAPYTFCAAAASTSAEVPTMVAVPSKLAPVLACGPLTLKLCRFSVLVLISFRSIWIVSPSLAPTCTLSGLAEDDRTLTPLKSVCAETRSISFRRSLISSWIDWRSLAELLPLAACTDSSRTRCRLLLTSLSAPSVVCASEMPSLALREACVRPLMLAVKRLAIAWPAASSLALLMRRPEDRRWMAVFNDDWDALRLFCVSSERLLVLMTCAMNRLLVAKVVYPAGGRNAGPVSHRGTQAIVDAVIGSAFQTFRAALEESSAITLAQPRAPSRGQVHHFLIGRHQAVAHLQAGLEGHVGLLQVDHHVVQRHTALAQFEGLGLAVGVLLHAVDAVQRLAQLGGEAADLRAIGGTRRGARSD